LFFLGSVGGSLMGLVVNSAEIVSVGASGAVMGLLAAALVTVMRFPPGAMRTHLQGQLLGFLIPSLIPLATHGDAGHVDYAAHFGGAIVGGLAGYVLLKIWPRDSAEPRFRGAAYGLAAIGVTGFLASLFFAKQSYAAYAEELSFSPAELLVEDGKIPEDVATAAREVETWGKDRPRDPRVRFFRTLRLLDEGKDVDAVTELRAGLSERQILDRAFGNKILESAMRGLLAEVLLQQGKRDEAKREAAPVCELLDQAASKDVRELGLCE
jgi:rhomboid protease GluP